MNDRQLKDLLAKMDETSKSSNFDISWTGLLIIVVLTMFSVNSCQTRHDAYYCYSHGYSHYEHSLCSKTVDGTDVTIRVADLPELEK